MKNKKSIYSSPDSKTTTMEIESVLCGSEDLENPGYVNPWFFEEEDDD